MILQPANAGQGSGPSTLLADCLAADAVGFAVRVTADAVSGVYQVTTVDIDHTTTQETIAFGVIRSKPSSTRCVVQTRGVMAGVLSGLTPGARMFVGATGALQEGPPARPGIGKRIFQRAAYVLSSTVILVGFEEPSRVTAA